MVGTNRGAVFGHARRLASRFETLETPHLLLQRLDLYSDDEIRALWLAARRGC
jgi:hypothetical protein